MTVTNAEIASRFRQFETIVNVQKDLINKYDWMRAQRICYAVEAVWKALQEKYQMSANELTPGRVTGMGIIFKLDPNQLARIDLSTIDAMLDANIKIWDDEVHPSTEGGLDFNGRRAGYHFQSSVRAELNHIWYLFLIREWFGKTKELLAVEEAVKNLPQYLI